MHYLSKMHQEENMIEYLTFQFWKWGNDLFFPGQLFFWKDNIYRYNASSAYPGSRTNFWQ